MVAVIFYSPLLLQTRVAHITAEGNITHEVHITRRRRIEMAHLLYRRCAMGYPHFNTYILRLSGAFALYSKRLLQHIREGFCAIFHKAFKLNFTICIVRFSIYPKGRFSAKEHIFGVKKSLSLIKYLSDKKSRGRGRSLLFFIYILYACYVYIVLPIRFAFVLYLHLFCKYQLSFSANLSRKRDSVYSTLWSQ